MRDSIKCAVIGGAAVSARVLTLWVGRADFRGRFNPAS
jgi:hypothetical protein